MKRLRKIVRKIRSKKMFDDFLNILGLDNRPDVLYHLTWIFSMVSYICVLFGTWVWHPGLFFVALGILPAWVAWQCWKIRKK